MLENLDPHYHQMLKQLFEFLLLLKHLLAVFKPVGFEVTKLIHYILLLQKILYVGGPPPKAKAAV
jgi:hypothetical protein